MAILPHDQILRLHAAIVAAGLADHRSVLLGGIELPVVASLLHAKDPSSQSLSDLLQLNALKTSAPLRTLLKNAVALAAPKEEAEVFSRALQLVDNVDAEERLAGPDEKAEEDPKG